MGTATGSTGWSSSIANDRELLEWLPEAGSAELAWFVREAWPSPATGRVLGYGDLQPGQHLELVAESELLVAFGDGIENDRLLDRLGSAPHGRHGGIPARAGRRLKVRV